MSKKMFFVSTGRCGTKRIQEILSSHLDNSFVVIHQMRFSRVGNILGNILYYLNGCECIKKAIFYLIIKKYDKKENFICTDPLVSMLIPAGYINSANLAIIHIERNPESFADSFIRLTKKRFGSFFAHNFVPIWQPNLIPFEKLWNKNYRDKYIQINKLKNDWFEKTYSKNPNYSKIKMEKLFSGTILADTINGFFKTNLAIETQVLDKKSNATS